MTDGYNLYGDETAHMSEIDVEAVGSIEGGGVKEVSEYVLYGGKGGVGKTTMAAATALASARVGTTTLVVSTDPAHSLGDVLERDVPAEPARIHPDRPLYGVEIDPDEALGTGPFGPGSSPLGDLGPLGLGEDIPDPFGPASPGTDEAAALQLLLEYLDDERFERVVVDTAPTGHTLRLLELPELLDSTLGRFVEFRERLEGMLSGMVGGSADSDAGLDDLRKFRERLERLRANLTDPNRTDFRVVMVPERTSVIESERMLDRLEEFEIPVETVIVNRVMEDLSNVLDAESTVSVRGNTTEETDTATAVDPMDSMGTADPTVIADAGGATDTPNSDGEADPLDAEAIVAPRPDSCPFCQHRFRAQMDVLGSADGVFRGREVKRVPLFAEEVRGEWALRIVGACLV